MTNPLEVSWSDRALDYIKEGVSGEFPVNPFTYAYKGLCSTAAGVVNAFSEGTGDRFLCPGELDDVLYNINFLEQHPDKEKDFFAINGAAAGLYKAVLVMQESYVSRYGAEECRVSGVLEDLSDLYHVMRPEGAALDLFEAKRGPWQFLKGRKHEPNIFKRIKNYIFGGKTKHVVWVNDKKHKVKRKHKHLFERIYEGITGGDHHRNVFSEFVHWFRRGKFVRRYLKLLDYIVEGAKIETIKKQYAKLQEYVREHLKEELDKKYGGNRYYYRKLGLMLNRLAWRQKDKWGADLQDDYGGMVPKINGKALKMNDQYIVKEEGYAQLPDGQVDMIKVLMTDYDLDADALLRYYDREAKDGQPWRRTAQNLNRFIHSGYFSYTIDELGREVEKPEKIAKTEFALTEAKPFKNSPVHSNCVPFTGSMFHACCNPLGR